MPVNPAILEFLKKKNPELFMSAPPPPISPSTFEVAESNSTTTARSPMPPAADNGYDFKLTKDDLPGMPPPLDPEIMGMSTKELLNHQFKASPALDAPKPPTMPGVGFKGAPGSNGAGTRKAPPVPPQIPGLEEAPPAPTGPSDREKLASSLDKKKKWALIASAIAGFGDAVSARGGGKSNFLNSAVSNATGMKEAGLKEFDDAAKKKKDDANDAEMNSASSPVSRSYQDAVLKLNPKMNEKQLRMLPASRLKDLLDTSEVVYKVDEGRRTREENKADKRTLQDEKLDQKRDQQNEKNVQELAKRLGDPQNLIAALNNAEKSMGFKLDDYDETNNTVGGKPIDLPGASVKGIGRVGFYSQKARELQSAVAKVFNVELKDRSGAAVTIPELERLKTEFSSGKFNGESELIKALKDYKRILGTHLRNTEAGFKPELVDTYRERGGVTSKDVQSAPEFATEQEAEAAAAAGKIQPGMVVKVGGRRAVWE